ncbi:hypothetical protein FJW07_04560 [Mesorhizobium sp. B3-1-9]|uniref:hypothetical protein n=1 Tax=unclassified Mesorhizobium TaxID=325217 RepID=UPI0011273F78|nr:MULTISPECIES: hypothetical protein [unclassified Mesorhizobium]TPI41789.1 hypothetical protein FJW07_04560 [Mesorhizobium sp. B3-1-9]TPI69115.1 hypothetical protein FJ424_06925 [Mesorhizobium sp. B3-1-8]TPI74882.1 hypothetical protein FJ420_04840 [Mesorhizobium sp. B3-1-3]TPJ35843.1 hypothetical protein FJ418_07520 [Mesorhizobium sp. B2-8-3]UCI25002.1 hypothetical protein FJ430_26040 [Mesorhizobium sp. B2-8-5]
MKTVATTALALAALTVAGPVIWTVAYNHQQHLGDRELISIAAEDVVRVELGAIAYASAEELLSSNPGCCIVSHSNHEWLRFPARLYEDGVSIVQMSYLIERTPKPEYYFREVAIDADGRILETRGIETDMQEHW